MELQGTIKKIGETQTFASGFQKAEKTDEEIWIPIIDFDNRYLISNKGRILSIERTINNNGGLMTKKEKILNPHIYKGYYRISLNNNSGVRKTLLLHRIIAKHFLFDYDENLKVNHKDGNKLNNKIENLEMTSQRENVNHYYGFLNNMNCGVYKKRDKWIANISINNKTVYLGTFKNKDEAINCRLNYELNNNIKNKYNELNKL